MKKATPEMIEILAEMKKGHRLKRDKYGWWLIVREGATVLKNKNLMDKMLSMELIIKQPQIDTYGVPYRIAAAGFGALRA